MAESFLERMQRSSHMAGTNVAYIEALYESFLEDPNSVPVEWREYFEKLPRVEEAVQADIPHSTVIQHFERLTRHCLATLPASADLVFRLDADHRVVDQVDRQ